MLVSVHALYGALQGASAVSKYDKWCKAGE